MNVKAGKYTITSSDYQFTLLEEKEVTNKETKEVSTKDVFVGYFPRIEQACSRLMQLEISRSDAETLDQLQTKIIATSKLIKEGLINEL